MFEVEPIIENFLSEAQKIRDDITALEMEVITLLLLFVPVLTLGIISIFDICISMDINMQHVMFHCDFCISVDINICLTDMFITSNTRSYKNLNIKSKQIFKANLDSAP